MSDLFNENGLQTATVPEIVSDLEESFRSIYGENISLESNTPDGQLINILAQKGVDVRGLLMQLYNSFNPDSAQGSVLDQRCAINNVFRQSGTFTTVNMNITTDRQLELQGVDENYNSPDATGYTVQDNEGNQFVLANTTTLQAGLNQNILFRAVDLGAVQVIPETITTPVTVVLGVVSVINPSGANETGSDEETDTELKIRRRQSVAMGAFGYLDGLQGALLQLNGVNDAKVYENYTSSVDENGTPAHCIWVVMDGGSTEDIANTIYGRKCAGTNMRGLITYNITTPAETVFTARWDNATSTPFYLRFSIKPYASSISFDTSAIEDYIENTLSLKIGECVETASLTALAQEAIDKAGGKGYAVSVQVSADESTWVEYLAPVVASRYTLAGITITEL